MSSEFKDYDGLVSVPDKDRHYNFLNMTATWICANANPSSWYVGCVIGALGMTGAFWASLVGNPLSYFFLALTGMIGFLVGVSTMALTRVSFGVRGARLPSLFNTMAFFGWSGVNTYIAAKSLSILLNSMLGIPVGNFAMIISIILIMLITGFIAIVGGSRAIRVAEAIASVGLMLLSIWIAFVIVGNFSFDDIMNWRPDKASAMSFGNALDVIAALGLSWVICVADYTRYTNSKKAATIAPMLGATLGMFWFCLIGSLSVIGVAVASGTFDPNHADPATICESLGMGNVAHVLIVFATIAVNLINIYSSGFAASNVSERLKPRTSMVIVATLSAMVALTPILFGSFLDMFQVFLGYLGVVFPPTVAIIIIDFYILRNRRYQTAELARVNGPYWYRNGINWYVIICWLLGAISYFIGAQIALVSDTIGAVFFCLIMTAIIYYLCGKLFGHRFIQEVR